MARLSIACAALAATLALVAMRENTVAAQDFKLHGVNYNVRAGADWEPDATKCKSAATIAQDLATLKRVTDTVRIYSLTDCDQAAKVLPAAVKAGLKVSLGLWVGPEPATFAAEKAKFQELLAQDGLVNSKDIVGIHVGSEAVYRGDVNTTVAIANFAAIKQLCTAKGLTDIPVSIADIGDVYLEHPELVDAVDVVSANAFPFWEKIDADKAAAYLYTRLEPLIAQAAAQKKEVIIGETGWATAGVNVNASDATPANAATYFRDFYSLAQQHQLKYFYFAGFDEQWKIATAAADNTVEAYFGLFDKTGALKAEYSALSLSNTTTTTKTTAPMTTAPTAPTTTAPTTTTSPTESALVPGTIHAGGSTEDAAGAATSSGKNGASTTGGSSSNTNSNSGAKQTVVVPDGKTSPSPSASTSSGGGAAATTSGKPNAGTTSSGSATNPAKQSADKRKDCAV